MLQKRSDEHLVFDGLGEEIGAARRKAFLALGLHNMGGNRYDRAFESTVAHAPSSLEAIHAGQAHVE